MEVTLYVFDESLEVRVRQFELDLENYVLKELLIEFRWTWQKCQVATVLRQASISDHIVLKVSVDYGRFEPLIISVSYEALTARKEVRAVKFTMRTIVWAKRCILADNMLHHAAMVVHWRVDNLATGPFILTEGCFIDVQNLVPGTHNMILFQLLCQRFRVVTDYILCTDFRIVDWLEGLRHRHYY